MTPRLIFEWARRTPGKTAMVYNGQPLSYRAFARSIVEARGFFVRRGCAGSGYAVLAIRNIKGFWILSLALRSLGLTTVVVRSAAELEDLSLPDIRCVVTSMAEPWPKLPGVCAARRLNLLAVPVAGERGPPLDAPPAAHTPGGHIVQTSGTTGTPKMVLTSAAMDDGFLRHKVELARIDQDSVLCVFGLTSSSGVGYRWTASPWTVGGTALIEQGGVRYQALLRPGITHAIVNPAMVALLLTEPADAFPRNDGMRLTCTGGSLTHTQVEQTKARLTPHIFNQIASTEAGEITYTRLDTLEDLRLHRLVPGRVVEIVDEADRPLPMSEIGRVRVGNAGGPMGYLGDETATRAHFKDGLFYPGDLAALRPEGRLVMHGRVTDVINLRGRKLHPAPIEDRLMEAIGVSGVCLFSMPDDSGEETLHIVIETPEPVDAEQVLEVLNRTLPGFPQARIHQFAALPRNEMGKVLRPDVRTQAVAALAGREDERRAPRQP